MDIRFTDDGVEIRDPKEVRAKGEDAAQVLKVAYSTWMQFADDVKAGKYDTSHRWKTEPTQSAWPYGANPAPPNTYPAS